MGDQLTAHDAAEKLSTGRECSPFLIIAREQFRRLDGNGDGSLDVQELSLFLKSLDGALTAPQIKEQLHEIDTNSDGKVSFQEFLQFACPGQKMSRTHSEPISAAVESEYSPAVGSAL